MPIKDEQLMRSSISLYRDNFKTIILYAFISMLPTLLISAIFGVVGKPSPENFSSLSTPILLVTGILFLAAIFSTLDNPSSRE
jgi:flagellar biosynthesis protein FliR